MKHLWNLLFLILCPHMDEGDGETPPDEGDGETPPDEGDGETPPDEGDGETPPDEGDEPPPKESRAQKEIRTLRERAQRAEELHQRTLAELDAARRQSSQPAQPSQADRLWQQEEDILKNPETQDWQRYAVQSARDAREAKAFGQNAVREARDLADRSSFKILEQTKPKLYAAYKDKVEDMLKEMRAKGNDAPREEILALIAGREMLAGTLKASDTKSTKSTGGADRGRTPGARSNVSASSGGLSEAQKREKRLENVRI